MLISGDWPSPRVSNIDLFFFPVSAHNAACTHLGVNNFEPYEVGPNEFYMGKLTCRRK